MTTMKSLNEPSLTQNLQIGALKRNWEEALHDQGFVWQAVLTVVVGVTMIAYMPDFFQRIQMRTGTVLVDPALNRIPAIDVSNYIFFILYSTLFVSIGYMIFFPWQFVWGVQAYCLLTFMRGLTVYFIPLDPNAELIPLSDPVLTHVFYHSSGITKDLFFSGHTATLFLIALVVHHKVLKVVFTILTVVIGALVMMQHIHYSYDVFAAPFFAWLSVFIMQSAGHIKRKLLGQPERV